MLHASNGISIGVGGTGCFTERNNSYWILVIESRNINPIPSYLDGVGVFMLYLVFLKKKSGPT